LTYCSSVAGNGTKVDFAEASIFFHTPVAKKMKYICMQHIEAVVLSVTSVLCSSFKSFENYESNVGIETGGMKIRF